MKPIRFSAHALDQAAHRGATVGEVVTTVREEPWRPADRGRFEAAREFVYNADWNGTRHGMKRVRPIFAERTSEIVIVTVYTYYYSDGEAQE